MTRKHRGIIQEGDNKGRLRKGFFYSGKRTKNGLPIIKEKKQNQNGGTLGSTFARNIARKIKPLASLAAAGTAVGEIAGKGTTKIPSVLSENVPKFSGNLARNFQKLQSTTQPIKQIIRMQDSTAPVAKPRKSVSKDKTPKSTKTLSIVPIHVRTNKLFSDILKTNRNTGMKSIKIIDKFIQETIESFLNPIQDGDLFMQLNNLEPIVILRIIVKTTRSLIENLAQASTEEEIKTTFNNNFNSFLSEEILNENLKSKDPSQRPLRDLFYNNPLNQTLLLTNNKNQLFNNKENILNLLNEYYNTLSRLTN